MIWFVIRYTIFGIFVAFTIYFVWKKKYEHLLWLYFFTFPFQNCAAFIITSWNPYKVVAIGMTFVMLFQPIKQRLPSELKQLFSYFIFLLMVSNIVGLLMPSPIAGLRGVVRLFVQDITYVLGFIPILYMKWLPWDFGERVLKRYTAAICTLIGIGFIHYAFLRAGIPFAPIIRDVGTSNAVAATQFGDGIVFRIYGLCGEPKNMAFALVPFVLHIIAKILIDKDFKKRTWLILFSSIFILFNTYSSAAYIEFAIGIIAVVFFATDMINRKTKFLLISVFLLCCTLIYSYTLVAPDVNAASQPKEQQTFFESFYERSFGRAQNELEEGRTETIIFQDFLQSNNLIYYLFGYGPGQYSFHSEELTFAGGYIPVQSGLVLNLVDFGLCGYLYFFFLLYFVLKLYMRSKGESDLTSLHFIIMGGAVLVGNMMYSMMGGSILIGMLPFIGIAYWIDYNNRNIEKSYD